MLLAVHQGSDAKAALSELAGQPGRIEQERGQDFTFKGKAIHPAVVRDLAGSEADTSSAIIALDLEACASSNRYAIPFWEREGTVGCRTGETLRGSFFKYAHIGTTPKGTHVLRTALNSGGSGVFCNVLFVRSEIEKVYRDGAWKERTVLKCTGHYGLGDRDNGALSLKGGRLTIGSSRNRAKNVVVDIE